MVKLLNKFTFTPLHSAGMTFTLGTLRTPTGVCSRFALLHHLQVFLQALTCPDANLFS